MKENIYWIALRIFFMVSEDGGTEVVKMIVENLEVVSQIYRCSKQ